ncbi:replicative DNA helicase [Candidatus Vidania fulgoroideorum]
MYSKKLECFLICLLSRNKRLLDSIKHYSLKDNDFFFHRNRYIYRTILHASNTILRNHYIKKLSSYVTSLSGFFPTFLHIPSVIHFLKHKRHTRNILNTIEISKQHISQGLPVEQVIDNINRAISRTDLNKPNSYVNHFLYCFDNLKINQTLSFRTGIASIDMLFIRPGDIVIIAGRPSCGKTALMLNICQRLSRYHGVLIFSLEMTSSQLVGRLLSIIGSFPISSIHKYTNRFKRSIIKNYRLYISDQSSLTPLQLRSTLQSLSKQDIRIVVIDYIQLMSPDTKESNRTNEISSISRCLKIIAQEFNICIFVISQLNRSVEYRSDKTPILSDLRESGSLEQDSDIVLMINNETYLDDNPTIQFTVIKNRNGKTYSFNLKLIKKYNIFRQ